MTPHPPCILLGLGSAAGYVAMRELGRRGVPVIGVGYDRRPIGRGSRYLSRFLVRPDAPLEEWLPALVRETGAGAVLPLRDRDIVDVAALGEQALGCRNLGVASGPAASVMDKALTLEAAQCVGIDVPASWQPQSADQPMPDLGWPVVLKWSDPLLIAQAVERLDLPDLKADYCGDEPELRQALLRYRRLGRYPLVQSYARGRGFGQFLYMAEGRAVLRFQHQRVHEWPPEGGVSSLCRAAPLGDHAAQMERSEALLAALGWDGFAMVEYRHDPGTGRYLLMEVNGHLWGSLALSSACGAEFAWEAYRRRVLGQTDLAPPPRAGLSARDTVKETLRIARLLTPGRRPSDPCFRATPWRDLRRYLAGFVDPSVRPYVFAWSDPVPSLWALAATVTRGLERVLAKVRASAPKQPRRKTPGRAA
jgi:predicted ATP-grasp superfamily ATP-dependent carboligase